MPSSADRPTRAAPAGAGAARTAADTRIPTPIWILVGAAFVIALGFGIVSPVLPAYARSFDVGVAAASVVVSAFAFFRLVFAPAGGALVTRLGERPVYLAGLLVVAVSSLATAFAQSYGQLLLFRGLGGIGSTMFTISAMALLVRLAPPHLRGRVSSAYASAFLVGGMAGPLLGGLLAGFGLRAPFVVYAVVLVVAAVVVAVGLGGERLPSPPPGSAERPTMTLAEAWSSPVYRAALVSGVANGWTNFGVRMAVLPLLAIAVLDEPWAAGVVLAVSAVGTAVTLQFSGRAADRVGRRPLVLVGLLVMGAGMGSMGLATVPGSSTVGLSVLLALAVVSGVGAGMVNPGQQAAVADVVGQERNAGKVLSVFQMAQDGGAIVGPILIGLVADTWGFTAAFAVTGAICVVGALPWLRAPEPLTLHQHQVPSADPGGR